MDSEITLRRENWRGGDWDETHNGAHVFTEKVTQCKPGNHLKWYVNQLKEEEEEEEEKKRKKCLALEPLVAFFSSYDI